MKKKKPSLFSRKKTSNPLAFFLLAILGLGLVIVLYKAVTSTSTESRSKAAETAVIYKNWEFDNIGDTESWVPENN